MKFWIVTPSYNQLEWLKLCVASVADQAGAGIEVHHHIQDAQSTDGTVDWLRQHDAEVSGQTTEDSEDYLDARCPVPSAYSFSFSSEKDEGMYDAINKGWKMAPDDVDVIAHLNCDEQYLTRAVKAIAGFMEEHPKTDIVLADMIVVDKEGEYVCHRRSLKPYAWLSKYCCGGMTATTFQRASVTKDKKVFFDASWRHFGDKVWYNALHKAGCHFAVFNQMVSVFVDTGENLNWTDEGLQEKRRYKEIFLKRSGFGTLIVARFNGLRRMLKDRMLAVPREFALYKGNPQREMIPIKNPIWRWNQKWHANKRTTT